MKQTKTLTFHYPINNGAFLQAYALQRVLIDMCKVENEIINYQSPEQKETYKIFQPIKGKSDLLKNAFSLVHYRKLKKRERGFQQMRERFFIQSEEVSAVEEVHRLAETADVNLVGSDQVWNTKISACTPAFFLQNVKAKKITYAVSCGSSAKMDLIREYTHDIESFDALGVREPSLMKVLEFYPKEKTVTLDPTLLLDKEAYACLYDSQKPIRKGEYILLYSMRYSDGLLKTVKRISEALGLPVVVPFTTFKTVKCLKYGFRIVYDASPDLFLNLIDHAKVVLTNSFHGTAFSVIFRKNFFHVCDVVDGRMKRDDRIDDLLGALGLDRNICLDSELDEVTRRQVVCYDGVEEKLQTLRAASLDFLQRQLS